MRPHHLRVLASIAAVLAVAAVLARVGADARWLAALGHVIVERHAIPGGIPFAGAPTSHWPNALVLAELCFYGLEHLFGDRGLMVAQLIATGGALAVLARDARSSGADVTGTSRALLLVSLGALPSLAIARVQMFSLLLFPVLLVLLRAEFRRPSWRLWLVVPLLALWSNLHGAALLGLLVVIVYLVLGRARLEPLCAAAVGLASLVALCLTPAGIGTISYYHGLLTNVAVQRGEGLWGPLSLTAPADIVTVLCAVVLGVYAWRARPPLWEAVMIGVLAVLTVKASRDGVWLLFAIVVPAAKPLGVPAAADRARRWQGLAPIAAAASLLVLGFAVVRGPVAEGVSPALLARAVALAHGSPVLAADGIDEQVALAGGRIWVGNPIDAFSAREQSAYLDWLLGKADGRSALAAPVRIVLVPRGAPAQALMEHTPGFALLGADPRTLMYARVN